MLPSLKSHPFEVEAFFESSTVLSFAIPKEELEDKIPECLTLDTFDDKWAFIAVAMVQTKSLRPKGFPKFMGNDFFLIGYRIFVRYVNNKGKRLRGLYIIGSETDKHKMKIFGNIFTHYNYKRVEVNQNYQKNFTEIHSPESGFLIRADTEEKKNIPLPENSPFFEWKEARRFAGPLPFTFTYDAYKKEVLIIEGVRSNWKPRPITVLDYKIPFVDNLNLEEKVLANAFVIENIPYSWKKGKIEKWKK